MHAQNNATTQNTDLTPEDLLLTPTVVYGFSLSDKVWRASAFPLRASETLTVLVIQSSSMW
jgi:hypothetical protein